MSSGDPFKVKCQVCSTIETKVIDSRLNQQGDITRRRRECPRCGNRFTTYERIEEVMPIVIKKDGRREPFNRQKILDGVQKACQKRSIPTQKIEELVDEVEKSIQQTHHHKEISSRDIGERVMAKIQVLDKIAYVRFASVYREFRDVQEFMAELNELPQ